MKRVGFDIKILIVLQLIFLFLQNPVFSQIITIGSATTTTSNVPTNTDVLYSYSQQIFTSTEITQGGSICGISLRTTSTNTFSRTLKIYLGHTTKTTFTSTTDWIPSGSLTQVFFGSVTLVSDNWVNITFDTPFAYNGTQNLVIAIDDNTQIDNVSTNFQYTAAPSKALYYSSSTINPSITTPPSGTVSNNRNNIKIHFCSPTSMTNTPLSTCDLLYSDPGGMSNYGNNQNFTQTITASTLPNNQLVVDFLELSIGQGDTLWVYDGLNTSSPLQGMFTNIVYPNQFSATGTAVTFRFKSDNSNTSSGWLAHIYCSTCDPVSFLLGSPCHPDPQGSTGYAASPFCTDANPYGITFPSATSGDGSVFLNTPVGCLSSVPRPAWYFMQINNPGNMLINITQVSLSGNSIDVDFACWGPFYALNMNDFMNRLCCGEYELYRSSGTSHRPTNGNHTSDMGGYPINNLIDCSYYGGSPEWCYIPNAQMGQFYILLITNYNGSEGTITFNTVAQYTTATTDCSLLAQVSNNGPLCSGNSIQLTCNNPQTNATYLWNGPNGFTSTLPNPIISNATTSNSGVYSLIITLNGQNSTPATTNVIVNPTPNVNLTASSISLCSGSSSIVTASGANSYLWSNSLGSGTTKTVTPLLTSTYTVTGTSLGCTDTAQITINVHPKPITQINTPMASYCPNIGTINISTTTTGGSGSYSYNWSGIGVTNTNSNNTQLSVNQNDCNEIYTIIVTATDQNGCFGKDTMPYRVIDTTPPMIGNLPISIQMADGTYPNYTIPNFSNLILSNSTDNCYGNSQLVYNQTPAAGTTITSGTYVQASVTDPCGNTKTIVIRVILPLYAFVSDSNNVSCFNGNNGSATISLHGGILPYTILWNSTPVQNSVTATSLSAGFYQATITDSIGSSFNVSVLISQPPQFTTQLSNLFTAYCPNTGNIPINCNTTGGYGTYHFSWLGSGLINIDNDSTTININANDCNEIYETIIIATDEAGCYAKDTSYIQVIDTIAPQFISLPFLNQTLTGTFPNYVVPDYASFVLANTTDNCTPNNLLTYNQSIPSGSLISSSTYLQVTVTDQCGNSKSAFIRLLLPIYGVASSSTNVSCFNGNNGSASVEVYGGILPYSYTWSTNPVQNNPTALQLVAGNYQVTITDSTGTTFIIPIQITQPVQITSTISGTNILCYGQNNGNAQIAVSGGVPSYSYLWNTGATNNTINNLTSGDYIVTVTDSHGCTIQNSITLTQPTSISLSSNVIIPPCHNNDGSIHITALGGVGPYSYLWNNGHNSSTLNNIGAGIYTCTVSDQHGCTNTKTDTIFNYNPMSIEETSSIMETCELQNGSISMTIQNGTPPYLYQWNNGTSTGTTLTNLNSGFYTITVTDQNQCTDTTSVFVDLFNIQSFIESITPSICERNDGSVRIRVEGGSGNYEFNWYNIIHYNNNFAYNLAGGQYNVSIKDLDCIDTINFIINEIHRPIACFETSTNIGLLINQSFLATNCSQYATQYHWDFGDGSSSQVDNPSHFYSESGLKQITLIASNDYDCMDTVSHTILVNEVSIIYIPNSFTPNGDGINDTFLPVCSFVKEEGFSMIIFNRWGQEIFSSNDFLYGWDGNYNGEPAPSGTYSYIIIYENLFGQPFKKIGSINILR